MEKKLITIVTPTFNEVENVEELLGRIKVQTSKLVHYQFEILIIDNCSSDGTQKKLRDLAKKDPNLKLIFNSRNFGHIRSPYYGIMQSQGAATIYMASDLQDPPELIPEFIREWENGFRLVMAVKPTANTSKLFHLIRKTYYRVLNKISEVELLQDSTGFGLYDRKVLDQIRAIGDPYPYLRGLISELGYEVRCIPFEQPGRTRGLSKNNLYTLYDIGMLGVVNHSKVPLRFATIIGFLCGIFSIFFALVYLVLKIAQWDSFGMGVAPILIGVFFILGIQFMFLGLLGEYILSIHTKLQNRPVVVEVERINF
jgi:dolichol-phosphate mannosyltransferase